MINTRQKRVLRKWLITLASKNKLILKIYLSVTGSFNREQNAVASGIAAYYKQIQSGTECSSPLLRRNTHRLEKGLIMRPRKSVFALEYIQDTVDEFRRCSEVPGFNSKELKWAYDVLKEYFETIEQDSTLKEHHQTFSRASEHLILDQTYQASPISAAKNKISVATDDFAQLCESRFSTRHFSDQKVSIEQIKTAVNIAATAPSACNRQPFKYYVCMGAKTCTEIASLAMGTKGYIKEINHLIVVTASLSNYEFERDRHVIYIDSSLATMQLVLALETMGLSSCMINWPDIEEREKKISRLLNLAPHQKVIMLVAFGYPDQTARTPYSDKQNHSNLMKIISDL